jgi:hypothetical protein
MPAPRPSLRGAACALLALLALAPALAPPAAAQAPEPATFEPQPDELLALGRAWLDRGNATLRGFEAAHPGNDTSVQRVFLEGAWDFLNESRLELMLTQTYQVEVQAVFDDAYPPVPAAERRDVFVNLTLNQTRDSRAALDAFWERLRGDEGRLRTTHGLEYALEAARIGIIADGALDSAANWTDHLRQAPDVEPQITRLAMLFTLGPRSFARAAGDVLDLAERVDAEPSRPALPDGALDRAVAAVQNRLRLDPDARSTTGPLSSAAHEDLLAANDTGPRVLYLARFLGFEEARASDAVGFRAQRGTLGAPALLGNLRLAVENASFLARYDGNVERTAEPPPLAKARGAGYQGVLQVDARNHAQYRVHFDPDSVSGLSAAWSQMVSSTYAAWLEQEVAAPRPGGGLDGGLLLYGGVAVAAALAVTAFAVLRRP